jgi:tRNA(fMet)-specific endonuclease VapC
MSSFLLDTDTLSLIQEGNQQVPQHVNHYPRTEIALSTISLQEQMQGFLAAVNRARNSQQLSSSKQPSSN